jgi:hypothetical protein
MLTKTERSFVIFQREFLNNILIMHPLVRQVREYEDILKFEDVDKWFKYENLPPSVETEIKEYWKGTLFGNNPYYLDPEFFEIIPAVLFNSVRFEESIEPPENLIISNTLFKNFKDVISEAIGGYRGLCDYDENNIPIENEEAVMWCDEGAHEYGIYHLDGDDPDWKVKLEFDSEIREFVNSFNSDVTDVVHNGLFEEAGYILYSERLLRRINFNLINEHINGSLELFRNSSYYDQQHIKIPPFIPKVFLSTFQPQGELLFYQNQLNYFSNLIPAGIAPHNRNNRYYFPQYFLEEVYGGPEIELDDFAIQNALKFECNYKPYVDDNGATIPAQLSIKSLVSEYNCLTKEIILDQPRIVALSNRYGYDYEDFCQAVLCKNLGFWLTQDLCAYPTQWFLRIHIEFLHFYSDYFANMLCENESQKNILALLALFGTKEHQSYYRIPVEVLSKSNFTLSIIDHLPSLKTDWNPDLYRPWLKKEDYEPDKMEAYQHELLKSYIPVENKNQFPEDFYLIKVIEAYKKG